MDFMSEEWKTIRLELASNSSSSATSASRAYFLQLPLSDQDEVDEEAYLRSPDKATFRRHWASEPDEWGTIHQSGRNWALRSTGKLDRILQLSGWPVRLGQHVSIVDHDGATLPLKIASVR